MLRLARLERVKKTRIAVRMMNARSTTMIDARSTTKLKPDQAEVQPRQGPGGTPEPGTLPHRCLMHLDCAPCLIAGMADTLQRTLDAIGFPCEAQFPPMPDHLVRKQYPAVPRN